MEIKVLKGDITKLKVGAIVNSASPDLLGGSGVDGAIHRVAGPELLKECKKLGGCKTGEAKITKGYNLPAKHVIHTVGPVYGRENGREHSCAEDSEDKAKLLANCYKNCLKLAQENNIRSIAFPAISTGAYGCPKDEAAKVAVKTIKDFCDSNTASFDEITFVCFEEGIYGIYEEIL